MTTWIKILQQEFARSLYAKTLWKSPTLRIFCDGGQPIIRWLPRFRRGHYAAFWRLKGFSVHWLGREIGFCFGRDVNGLYR